MKLFLSPFKPAAYLGAFAALLLCVPLARFYTGDGGDWTILGAAALAIMFMVGGSTWPAMNQLGASYTAWLNSAAAAALLSSLVLALPTAASAAYHQTQSPYYMWYDPFLITSGAPMDWIDGNGQPYTVAGAGQDAGSLAATVAFHVVVFLLAAALGLATGLTFANRKKLVMFGAFFVAAFAGGLTGAIVDSHTVPSAASGASSPNPYVAAVAVGGAIILAACAWAFATTRRFVR